MSRIAFCQCGFIDPAAMNQTPSLSPLNGWFLESSAHASTEPGWAVPSLLLPFPMPMEDLILLFWRAREITVTYDITITPTDGGDSTNISGSAVIAVSTIISGPTYVPLDDEQQLITDNSSTLLFATNGDPLIFLWLNSLSYDGTNVWPQIEFGGSLSGSVPGLQFYDDPSFFATSITFTSTSVPGINGVPIYTVDGLDSYSGSITFEITRYWQYASTATPLPPDPGPVFDETTGVQLIVPAPPGL